jgi:hypothetical protein
MRGFDALLVFRLARQPAWLLGFACMLAGFAFQVSVLALVQPILAVELLFVFAYLGIATGIIWGFIAAVIKELSSHISGGPAAIFNNWSAYVLMGVGAVALLLTSHAMATGPLAASQPGFTIGDPVTAILLGVFLFNERLGTSPAAMAAEVAGLVVLALGVWTLSGSALITDTTQPRRTGAGEAESRELTRRSR